jgi:antitoxin HicB
MGNVTPAAYPLSFLAEGGDIVVRSRDFPELLTAGGSEEEAIDLAEDALEVVALTYLEKGLPLPPASQPAKGERIVYLPAQVLAKIAVVLAWRQSAISKSELARRMGVAENEVRRILDPSYGTKLDKLDAAARALGHHLIVGLAA